MKMAKILEPEDLFCLTQKQVAKLVGRKIRALGGGVGTVVLLNDGFKAIRVILYCYQDGCKRTRVSYLRPGPGGPDHYVVNKNGKFLADLRDKVFTCSKHRIIVK